MINWNVGGLRQNNRSSSQACPASLPIVTRRQKLSMKCEVDSKQSSVGAKIPQLPVHFQRANLQSWPKIMGRFPKFSTKYLAAAPPPPPTPHAMLSCCCVYAQSGLFQWLSTLLGGGLQNLAVTAPSSLIATGFSCPKHKHTLQTLFSYLSWKILARIVALHCGLN